MIFHFSDFMLNRLCKNTKKCLKMDKNGVNEIFGCDNKRETFVTFATNIE